MAQSALAGEMSTKIRVQELRTGEDADGYPVEEWTDVFARPVWCKWVNAHGTEAFEAMRLDLGQMATLTMRYTPHIHVRCRVYHENDPVPYSVVSMDNVGDARKFLEIKIRREVPA